MSRPGRPDVDRDLVVAAWRTWGARGIGRRAAYEATKRSGRLRRAETQWLTRAVTRKPLRSAGITPPQSGPGAEGSDPIQSPGGICLYGALQLDVEVPPDWHRHPLSGHRFEPHAHWSDLSDAAPEQGDIKDLWELSRFGWLQPWLGRWAATGDEVLAEAIWVVVEDWVAANPPYQGPHWMCGQETSLRAIGVMFLADALAESGATTPARQAMVAALVDRSVGRVAPTLGYALSQRNNHATSEAGFLWTASVLAPDLPGADELRRGAARAMAEAVADQFAPDGSYAQHSPTYERVALHVMLWCLAVARETGEEPPEGVLDAVGLSVGFLRPLMVPGSSGRMPNLGGNDGALVFNVTGAAITDFRPLLAHAAAVSGQPNGLQPGPWDREPAWFGLGSAPEGRSSAPGVSGDGRSPMVTSTASRATVATHALTRGSCHAVLRAGPLDHRPAHADQLHVDVWIDGTPVAVDPGSYRYTAVPPWANALAGEDVHNLPRRPGSPQAVRSGRFFWRQWREARLVWSTFDGEVAATLADLVLPDGTCVRRLVAVADDLVVVLDQADAPTVVRWNLTGEVSPAWTGSTTEATGLGWSARFHHGSGASVPTSCDDDPTSGWQATSYAVREPVTALLLPSAPTGRVVSCFVPAGEAHPGAGDLNAVVAAVGALDLARVGPRAVSALLRRR